MLNQDEGLSRTVGRIAGSATKRLGHAPPRADLSVSSDFSASRTEGRLARTPPRPGGGRFPGVSARSFDHTEDLLPDATSQPLPELCRSASTARPEASSIPADANPLTTRVSNLTVSRTGQGKTTDQRDLMSNQSPNLLAHHDGDAVAVAARDLSTGPVGGGYLEKQTIEDVDLVEAVPLGHELALWDVAEGELVLEALPVGTATADIRRCDKVRTRKVRSPRWPDKCGLSANHRHDGSVGVRCHVAILPDDWFDAAAACGPTIPPSKSVKSIWLRRP